MITSVKAENVAGYKALFEEATDILSGYKKVRTYDMSVGTYYYKDEAATTFDERFKAVAGISDLASFASALASYSALYVKEGEVVEGFVPMNGITTLEEYFSWIATLAEKEGGRKYTVLPLDEEHFEINANTRVITIPTAFKKNGVAVQSDDLAEVLYFKIDRYFDYMDLNNCEIFIQWETPKNKNGEVIKSVSPVYHRDIESEPGKLIFGWALSDAITATAGTLKFSVRFFQWGNEDEKIIDYSFNTLTAQVTVNPSIGIDPEIDEYILDDVGDRLLGRLKNSEVVGGLVVAEPRFDKDLDEPNSDLIYDLPYTVNEDGEVVWDTYRLLVQAYASDTGAISYTWRKQELTEDNATITVDETTGNTVNTAISLPLAGTNVFVLADMDDLDSSYAYYVTNGTDAEGEPVYIRYTGSLTDPEDGTVLYIKQNAYVADSVGVYWAVAENRITNSSTSTLSLKATFPYPDEVVITAQPEAKAIIVDGEALIGVEVEEQDSDVQLKTYQWYQDTNKDLNFGENAPNFVAMEGETNETLSATVEGHYYVEITNTRNKESKTLISEYSRVTNPAETPDVIESAVSAKSYRLSALTDINCPSVTLNASVYSDEYTVSWYLDEDNGPKLICSETLIKPETGNPVHRFNPRNYEETIKALSVDGDLEGFYYPIVTNHVNGSQASTSIPSTNEMFSVNS